MVTFILKNGRGQENENFARIKTSLDTCVISKFKRTQGEGNAAGPDFIKLIPIEE